MTQFHTAGIRDAGHWEGIVDAFIIGVTIVVVAVPEGLPLAVTISLAYSMSQMYKDQILVRLLAACETMGGVTSLCSDKTGTLTENRMTVVDGKLCGVSVTTKTKGSAFSKDILDLITSGIGVNSDADVDKVKGSDTMKFQGNKTECALLVLTHQLGLDYKKIRKSHESLAMYPFLSSFFLGFALMMIF